MGGASTKVEPGYSPKARRKQNERPHRLSRDHSGFSENREPLPPLEESTEEDLYAEKTESNDRAKYPKGNIRESTDSSQGVPNGNVKQNEDDSHSLGQRQRSLTSNSLKPESEVSIVISNASEEDSDSVHYTVQDNHDVRGIRTEKSDLSNKESTTSQTQRNNPKMGSNASTGNRKGSAENNRDRKFSKDSKMSTDRIKSGSSNKLASRNSKQKTNNIEENRPKPTTVKYPNTIPNGGVVQDTEPSGINIHSSGDASIKKKDPSPTSNQKSKDNSNEEVRPKKKDSLSSDEKGLKANQEKRVRISASDPVQDADDFYTRLSMRMERNGYLKEQPCVDLFKKTFKEYASMPCHPPKDKSGTIIPCPSLVKKKELLKSEDFKSIDIHASKIPEKMITKSIKDLVKFLIKPAGSNKIERIRALFTWLVTLDLNESLSDSSSSSDSEEDDEAKIPTPVLIRQIKDDEMTYAELFNTMCKIAGVQSRSIVGLIRGFMDQPSNLVTETVTATWSAVVINNSWRLVDVHRAALIYKAAKEIREESHDLEEALESAFEKRESPISDYVDFYFLTDPEVFVFSHLPDEENFQFLPRPVSYAEFTYLPYLKPHYFILGFEENETYESLIEVVDGKLELKLLAPGDKVRKMSCCLHKVEGRSYKNVSSASLRDYVYLESDMTNKCFNISVNIPAAGTYVLELNGRGGYENVEKNYGLCSYVIKCSKSFQFEPYIENDREEWGPGSDCIIAGLKPLSNPRGKVILSKGEGRVEFEMTTPVYILHTLNNKENKVSELSNYVVHRFDGSKILIYIRVPKPGEYALKIFSRQDNDTGVFVNVCTYHVLASDDVPHDTSPFPRVDDGLIGVNKFFRKLNMEMIQPENCIISSPPAGRLKFKINLAPNVHYLVEFKLCSGNSETPMHEYTTWSLMGLMGTFRLRFPQQGMYLFSLYAILPDHDDQVHAVYNAIINCNWPSQRCFPFPTSLASWTPFYKCLSPRDVYLISGTVVRFLVDIPDAVRVTLIGNKSEWQLLEKQEDGLWSNDITIEPGQEGKYIKMFASIEEGSHSLFSLLQFKIVSKAEMEEMEHIQMEHYESALRRIEKMKEGGVWEEPEIYEDKRGDGELDDGFSQIAVTDPIVHETLTEEFAEDEYDYVESVPKEAKKSPRAKKVTRQKRIVRRTKKSKKKKDNATPSASTRSTETTSTKGRKKREDSDLYEETSESSEDDDVDEEEVDEDSDSSEDSWEARLAEFEEWKRTHKKEQKKNEDKQRKNISHQLLLNRMKAATKRREKLELIRTTGEWRSKSLKRHKPYKRAMRMLDIINLRDDLKTHLTNRNLPRLKDILQEIEIKGYTMEIMYEVSQARARIQAADSHVFVKHRQTNIDVQMLAEIRSYARPQEIVHKVVVAMLLVLGVPEKNTKKWKKCQKRCVTFGKYGLYNRLHEIQPDEIHPSIAARAREILEGHSALEADTVSPGVGALFTWVKQITREVLKEVDNDKEEVKPAHRKQQNELLRENTELSREEQEFVESQGQSYVIREKTQSHFRTREKIRRDPKKIAPMGLESKQQLRSVTSRNKSKSRENSPDKSRDRR